MCRHFPKTASEMRRISGVGDVKLERYAEDFIAEIRTYGTRGAQKQDREE
jgi:superfamily II DNA helicase RecQ